MVPASAPATPPAARAGPGSRAWPRYEASWGAIAPPGSTGTRAGRTSQGPTRARRPHGRHTTLGASKTDLRSPSSERRADPLRGPWGSGERMPSGGPAAPMAAMTPASAAASPEPGEALWRYQDTPTLYCRLTPATKACDAAPAPELWPPASPGAEVDPVAGGAARSGSARRPEPCRGSRSNPGSGIRSSCLFRWSWQSGDRMAGRGCDVGLAARLLPPPRGGAEPGSRQPSGVGLASSLRCPIVWTSAS